MAFPGAEEKTWLLQLHVGVAERQDSFAAVVFHLCGIDVCFCFLDAGEDLLKKSLVLGLALLQPLVHGLHVFADGLLHGFPLFQLMSLSSEVSEGAVARDGPGRLDPCVAHAVLVLPAFAQKLFVLLQQGVILLVHFPQDGHAPFAHVVSVQRVIALVPTHGILGHDGIEGCVTAAFPDRVVWGRRH